MRVLAMIAVVFYHCLCGYSDIWGGQIFMGYSSFME